MYAQFPYTLLMYVKLRVRQKFEYANFAEL
jgi:hypothetical protein